ncbi:MAG: hypothetical protein AB7G12_05210 [Thermoanaerobaculia bacterium]
MSGYLQRQFGEIRADRALSIYGACLALTNVVGAFFWRSETHSLARVIGPGSQAICWPWADGCASWRVLSTAQIDRAVLLYGIVALLTAALYASRRIPSAWVLHLALEATRLFVVGMDFRLRQNQHYMGFFVGVAFLFFSRRREVVRLLVVFFYVWAGLLKLNREWLTGAALYAQPWFVPASWNAVACSYVVVLEIVFSWGVLARRAVVFWFSFLQLVWFHVVSWGVVGFSYPMLMFGILTVFPLMRWFAPPAGSEPEQPLLARFARLRLRPATIALLLLFSLLQLLPRLIPGDSTLTGEGRVFALHMFDARIVCDGKVTLHDRHGRQQQLALHSQEAVRIACDPLLYWRNAQDLCSRVATRNPDFSDLDLVLDSRHSNEMTLHRVLDIRNFCTSRPQYRLFSRNDWIRIDG